MATHLDPAKFARSIMIEAADIPADMTIAQWRESRRRSGRRWRIRSAARRLLLPRPAAPDAARLLAHDV
jgi:hypothetical protein